ncbi:MAG: hypothetical protein ABFD66_07090, partial [Smithella sp.]
MADKTIKVSKRSSPTKSLLTLDDQLISDAKDHAQQMKSDDGKRDQMFDEIDQMYLMTWSGKSGKNWSKSDIKVSPDARNAALGATRLLVATDPIFNVVNSSSKQE